MRALSAAELLDVWEHGLSRPPVERALLLLGAACPETPPDDLARLSVGRRDARLLTLREWTFGPRLDGLATCPGCGERVELGFNAAEVRLPQDDAPPDGLTVNFAGSEMRFWLPNSLDLAAVAGCADAEVARRCLLERCVTTDGPLSPDVAAAVVARMAEADPQADVQLALSCPACGRAWQAAFDVVSFFWGEINAWARRLLREVHTLAAAYGWREADILALSPRRRQLYLEMVGG